MDYENISGEHFKWKLGGNRIRQRIVRHLQTDRMTSGVMVKSRKAGHRAS